MRNKLENYFTNLWYGEKKPNVLLRGLSKAFDTVRLSREKKLKKSYSVNHQFSVPVIVVGNISVGGTGKTPVVLFLIQELRKLGYTVGVISRGYGGSKSKQHSVVLTESSTAEEVGDEARMIHKLASVPFAVGSNRLEAAQMLLDQNPEISLILSDDGLQHYRLQRDVEILIIDGQRGFGNQHLLPAGPLREPLSRVDSVDMVLVNGEATHESLIDVHGMQFDLQSKDLKKLNSEAEVCDLKWFHGKTVHAFAGIGNPERFFTLLESMGIEVMRHSLPDHALMPKDFFVEHENDILIMTEKDAVKYPYIFAENFWYLPVEVKMNVDDQAKLIEVLGVKLRERNDL